ncbi:DUF3168 domain-containing protein [Neorhizobium sp. JUb45]|uniref:DUF3168 domain-containing protein n=1 Tax=unclassified Neorhizobium TaxID=2629175 RepID=UPI0010D0185C|nr:uncharacterized protein DUF3168 [Neorhizobium sp. JUb45]
MAVNALMKAIFARLSGDAELRALVGPDGVRDRMLARAELPCVVFGETDSRDEDGETLQVHLITLEVWSLSEGRRETQVIAARVRALLHDAAMALEGAVLVSLLHRGTRTRREAKTKFQLAEMRFRAVTE